MGVRVENMGEDGKGEVCACGVPSEDDLEYVSSLSLLVGMMTIYI